MIKSRVILVVLVILALLFSLVVIPTYQSDLLHSTKVRIYICSCIITIICVAIVSIKSKEY